MAFQLNYGRTGRFHCDIDPGRILAVQLAPPPVNNVGEALQAAFEQPLDFPPLAQLFTPGDHVVLALDRHTPHAADVVIEAWKVLEKRGVEPGGILVLQPAGFDRIPLVDPRLKLPDEVRKQVEWVVHDPTDRAQQAYLATTAEGERIYLARRVVEADVCISIGLMAYDPLIGCRGTSSVFYPGLSSIDALARTHGLGHSELGPDDERPLRRVIDEIAWLLGTQFTIQMISAGGTEVANVLAGAHESVFRRGKQLLAEHWSVRLENRVPVVIVAVDADAAGHGWHQIGAALATARNLVEKGGKVVVLSQLSAELDTGLKLIRENSNPRNVIQSLRKQAPPDLIPATQLASAADWANVYLLSAMDSNVVDDLFMTPLENETEVERLLRGEEQCVILGSAQHVFGQVQAGAE